MRAHVIEGGVVVNTIEVEDLDFLPNLIDAELGGQIGDLWNGTSFTSPSPEPKNELDPIDFLRLFTPEETFTILQAAAVDPMVATFKYRLDHAKIILLSDPDIQAGIPLLEAGGLIGAGRAAQILAGELP